ncbi:MAG: hypothetical protein ACKO0Z_22520 [Betaproteobacteria bacterium]
MKSLLAFLTLSSLLIATPSFAQSAPAAASASPATSTPLEAKTPPTEKTSQILAQQRTGIVCTIYAGNLSFAARGVRITQYSTMGLVENCDESHFNQLTIASIGAQLRAVQQPLFIIQGAAHHYLMDVNLASLPKPFVRIGELKMSPVGFADINLSQLLTSKGLREGSIVGSEYSPFPLTSNIHYIWNIGKPVHRLVAPNGDRYVMFGYTNRVLKGANKDNLSLIGPLLTLPANWKYESYLLDRTLTIKTDPTNDFTLNILFDDAFNMYIQSTD